MFNLSFRFCFAVLVFLYVVSLIIVLFHVRGREMNDPIFSPDAVSKKRRLKILNFCQKFPNRDFSRNPFFARVLESMIITDDDSSMIEKFKIRIKNVFSLLFINRNDKSRGGVFFSFLHLMLGEFSVFWFLPWMWVFMMENFRKLGDGHRWPPARIIVDHGIIWY